MLSYKPFLIYLALIANFYQLTAQRATSNTEEFQLFYQNEVASIVVAKSDVETVHTVA